jgi:hypothetical protein
MAGVLAVTAGLSLVSCGSTAPDRGATASAHCRAEFDKIVGDWKPLVGQNEYAKEKRSFVTSCKAHPKVSIAALAEQFDPEAQAEGPIYDEVQLEDWLELKPLVPGSEDDGYVFRSHPERVRCWVTDLFTSREEVGMYASAQSNVAVTPEGNAGVEVGGDNQRTCMKILTMALEGFETVARNDD